MKRPIRRAGETPFVPPKNRSLVGRLARAAVLGLVLHGCAGPGYYLQAVGGHFELMRARQDIDAYLATAPASDPLAPRLKMARDVLQFADSELGLPVGDSYVSVAITGRDAVVWNVVATPEFSLRPKTWCFPVAGCVPYRGYFELDHARREGDRLARKGMDVSVSAATAYSSLGWFKDPLLDTVLALPDAHMAGTLIHELAHRRLYVKGDADFNESYATFLEREGVRAWLLVQGREDEARRWQDRLSAQDGFQALLSSTRGRLESIYASGLAPDRMREQKNAVFLVLQQRHARMVEQEWQGLAWFADWFDEPPNNADLALVHSYLGGLCAFRLLHDQAGGDFNRFQLLAERKAALPRDDRSVWLARDCP